MSLRRKDYLQRLGIQHDRKGSLLSMPKATAEAPYRLETTGESRRSSFASSASSSRASDSSIRVSLGSSVVTGSDVFDEASRDDAFEMNMLNLRAQDDFRVSFLRQLSYRNVWIPSEQRPKQRHQTVVIFDWDDTLLCTTYLNFKRDDDMSDALVHHLEGIEANALKCLQQALKTGHTFIITNAAPGWVQYTCAKYLPGLRKILQEVSVISARGKYEAQCPNAPGEWKVQAFLEVQRQLDSQVVTNLISVGDSNFEMDAVHIMGKEFAHAVVKTIKFKEHPTAQELHKELELTAQKFDKICLNASNLKISLERKDNRPGGTSRGGAAPGYQQSPNVTPSTSVTNSDGHLSVAVLAAAEARKTPVVRGFNVTRVPSPTETPAPTCSKLAPQPALHPPDSSGGASAAGLPPAAPVLTDQASYSDAASAPPFTHAEVS